MSAMQSLSIHPVIPADAGIQFVGLISFTRNQIDKLDSGLRRNDSFFPGPRVSVHRFR